MTSNQDKKLTIDTYDGSALAHAQKFDEIGARAEDIKKALSYIRKIKPKIVEIGCGNGRDAKEIIKHTSDYVGVDLSKKLIELAKKNVPNAKFEIADLESYKFPERTDVVFAFASLLHSDKESVRKVLDEAFRSLSVGGVFFISLKYGKYHRETIDKEGHGPKVYYFYTSEDIQKLSPPGLTKVAQNIQDFKGQKWFSIILQKKA